MSVSFSAPAPLALSALPVALFALSLFRLSLNIVCLWLVLGPGTNGAEATGKIIGVIGSYVAGIAGMDHWFSLVIGGVIFLVLALIQFKIIVDHSGGVKMAATRFKTNFLPGRQMRIDADRNARLIDKQEWERRHDEMRQLCDLHTASEEVATFVRNDSISTFVITGTSMLFGFAAVVFRDGMGLMDAARMFTAHPVIGVMEVAVFVPSASASRIRTGTLSHSVGISVSPAGVRDRR